MVENKVELAEFEWKFTRSNIKFFLKIFGF